MVYRIFNSSIKEAILALKCQKFRMIAFSIYCLLSGGCGKKVEKTTDDNNTRTPALSTNKVLLKAALTSGGSSKPASYKLAQMGEVLIPPYLEATEGSAGNREAKVSFNLKDGKLEIFCKYEGNVDRYELDNCYTSEDIHESAGLNFPAGYGLIVDPDHSIKLEILNSNSSSATEATGEFEILWH